MKINGLYSLIVLVLVGTMACKTAKKAQKPTEKTTTTAPPRPLSINEVLTQIESNALNTEWLSGDAAMDFVGKPMNVSASASIRNRKDSVIWMNVKKFGFGVARILVRRDSIFALNLMQSQYLAQDFKYVEKKVGVPLSFEMLQDFLVGKLVFLTPKDQLTIEKTTEGDILLRGDSRNDSPTKNGNWVATYRIDGSNFVIKQMSFDQPNIGRNLTITYSNTAPLNGVNFAYLRTIEATSIETGKVKLELELDAQSVEVNVPKTIRFEIPSHYEKME